MLKDTYTDERKLLIKAFFITVVFLVIWLSWETCVGGSMFVAFRNAINAFNEFIAAPSPSSQVSNVISRYTGEYQYNNSHRGKDLMILHITPPLTHSGSSLLIEQIREANLCSGCGACSIVCPYDAVGMRVSLDGAYRPFIDFSKCTHCELCGKVCPSLSINRRIEVDGLGNFIHCYIGYSTDANIRWSSSSGGLAATLLLSLLEEGMISGAVVVSDNPKDPLRPLMTFVRGEEEIRKAMGSRYCPVEPRLKVKDMISEEGKIAVVGLPCHIWAFRKLEEVDEKLKEKILIHLGLFCGKSPNFYATAYFLRKVAGEDEGNVAKVAYRGRGWPGKITVITKQGNNFTFEYGDWINFSYYPHFFPVRCVLCYDITNQLADISVGDAWGLAHDNVGTSVIITRTNMGERILQHLCRDGRIILREVSPEHVSKGQGLDVKVRRSLIRAYIWWKVFKQPIPFTAFAHERLSVKDWIFNLGYCIWLYMAQNPLIRTILCNLTPYISKLMK